MEDAVAAVKWTLKHLSELGAAPRGIFLSGHSAGGNIVANLACGTWLDHVLDKYNVKLLGVFCISGVYSLLNPLGGCYASIKNKSFDKLYRKRVFGSDMEVLARHSPVAQLRMMLGELPYPLEQCRLCNLANSISHWMCPDTTTSSSPVTRSNTGISDNTSQIDDGHDSTNKKPEEETSESQSTRLLSPIKTPENVSAAFLIMNAESDIGLEADGQRFTQLLERVQTSPATRPPRYSILPHLEHATITLDQEALTMAGDFILSVFQDGA
jgi:acetyl esterase/lipase